MVRRAFWLSTGMVVGAASSVSMMRRLRRQARRLAPSHVGRELGSAVSALTGDLRSAVAEGRDAMHEREAQLWAELDPRRPLRSSARNGSSR